MGLFVLLRFYRKTCLEMWSHEPGNVLTTEGEVRVKGLNVFEHPFEVKTITGYMPEYPPLYLDLTVKEYVRFAAELRGVKGKAVKEAVERALDLCGLSDVSGRLVGNLSKGYRQRVGLAQAIVHDPEVLVLDEPTVGLDPKQIVEIRRLIRELGRDRTVILSTHILQEVTAICDSVVIINNGRIVLQESLSELPDRFSKQKRLTVRVRYPEAVKIKDLEGIVGVSEIRHVSNGVFLIVVESEDTVVEVVVEVFEYLGNVKAGVVELKPDIPSLEGIFIKAVSEDEIN